MAVCRLEDLFSEANWLSIFLRTISRLGARWAFIIGFTESGLRADDLRAMEVSARVLGKFGARLLERRVFAALD